MQVTESLYNEPMQAVVATDHPLAAKARVGWADLAQLPCVLPPPWASLRVKLEQQFYRDGLQPPADVIESASFLAQVTFIRGRNAVGFMAASVARHFESEGLVRRLRLEVPVELPPVGLIVMRARPLTPVTEQLVKCLRQVAQGAAKRRA